MEYHQQHSDPRSLGMQQVTVSFPSFDHHAQNSSPKLVLEPGIFKIPQRRKIDPEKQTLYKTELCKKWMSTGTCRYGSKCQFAHGRDELRTLIRHPLYKTTRCKTFAATGSCRYGSRCRFIHNETELELNNVPRVAMTPNTADHQNSEPNTQISHQQVSSPVALTEVRKVEVKTVNDIDSTGITASIGGSQGSGLRRKNFMSVPASLNLLADDYEESNEDSLHFGLEGLSLNGDGGSADKVEQEIERKLESSRSYRIRNGTSEELRLGLKLNEEGYEREFVGEVKNRVGVLRGMKMKRNVTFGNLNNLVSERGGGMRSGMRNVTGEEFGYDFGGGNEFRDSGFGGRRDRHNSSTMDYDFMGMDMDSRFE